MNLNAPAPLTIAERLAIADQLRKAGPELEYLDVPAIVSEDRERRQ